MKKALIILILILTISCSYSIKDINIDDYKNFPEYEVKAGSIFFKETDKYVSFVYVIGVGLPDDSQFMYQINDNIPVLMDDSYENSEFADIIISDEPLSGSIKVTGSAPYHILRTKTITI